MPTLDNMNLPAAFSSHLKPDEQLKHWAYGVKQSIGLLLIIALAAGAISLFLLIKVFGYLPNPGNPLGYIPFGIVVFIIVMPFFPLIQKEYIIGVTDNRLLIIRIKKSMFTSSVANAHQADFTEYPLQNLPPVNISPGALKSSIKINDSLKPFSAKFTTLIKGNREQVEAITNILNER